jgi:asparagine synthase (glutamine-hydrolysing)
MCGIAGFWSTVASPDDEMTRTVQRMAETLSHRGPDDAGTWADHECGIALGFRRLAILELSPLGHQPMASESGRYVVVFNGEIYNFKELRRELESFGHRFRGGSDTEVILAAAEQWGFENAVRRFNGMFALALWDRQSRSLSLARDHLGIKPVYYGWCGHTLLFASELKALRAHPDYDALVDRSSLALYVRHSFVPGPFSIYHDTFKLEPGCVVTFRCPRTRAVPIQYWSVTETAEKGIADPDRRLETEVLDDLQSLLSKVVKQQMVADVALGAFLSGGIDSSLVVALMQSQSTSPVRTFSIGFEEQQFDETPYARAIASHLGTDHTEMYVTAQDAQRLIPALPDIYDEPFADSSGIPTSLLAKLTRQHVTVSLTGDGGDELFGGYWQYWELPKRWRAVNRLPRSVRSTLARGLGAGAHCLHAMETPIAERISKSIRSRARYLTASHPDDFIRLYLSRWIGTPSVVVGASARDFWLDSRGAGHLSEAIAHRFMLVDAKLGLPDDMLTKVDRAASAASLETRIPLLDPRLVAFAWRLPLELKVGSQAPGKWILRALLRRYLPAQTFERAKQGFGVPIACWVRGPLRDWAEALLDEARLRREGFLDAQRVRSEWRYLLDGRYDWDAEIWSILTFQAWHERWVS